MCLQSLSLVEFRTLWRDGSCFWKWQTLAIIVERKKAILFMFMKLGSTLPRKSQIRACIWNSEIIKCRVCAGKKSHDKNENVHTVIGLHECPYNVLYVKGVACDNTITENYPASLQFPTALLNVQASFGFDILARTCAVSVSMLSSTLIPAARRKTLLPAQHQIAHRPSQRLAGEQSGAFSS